MQEEHAAAALERVESPADRGERVAFVRREAPAKKPSRTPDVIYVPTPHEVVEKMLDMAKVKKGDVVYDLGCGDGQFTARTFDRMIDVGLDPWHAPIRAVRS